MTPPLHRSRIAILMRAAAPLIPIAAIAALLLRFPPAQSTFYPRCPIYSGLHLLCPGCGATRALASLLHGHLHEALRDNALITLLVGPALLYAAISWLRFLQREPVRWPQISPAAIHAALAVAMVFTVLRNLP